MTDYRWLPELKTALPSPVSTASPSIQSHKPLLSPRSPKSSRPPTIMLPTLKSPRALMRALTTKSTYSSPNPSFDIEGVPLAELSALYHARCEDLKIPVISDQESRFLLICYGLLHSRRFELKECGIGKNSAKIIGKILSSSQDFGFVNLAGNSLGDLGAVALVEQIVDNAEIAHLDLSSNDITSEGAASVFGILRGNTGLVSLNLSSNEGVNRNRMRVNGVIGLVRYLKVSRVLTHLNLAGTLIGNQGIGYLAEGLRGNQSLLVLNVANNELTQAGTFLEVVACTRLEELILAQNRIGDAGALALSRMFSSKQSPLAKLDVSKNSMTSAQLAHLFQSLSSDSKLKYLNLEGNRLSKGVPVSFIQFMRENGALTTLNLAQNGLADPHMQRLAMGLSDSSGVLSLNLANNSITDAGALFIAEALAKNSAIRHLNLNGNYIKNDGCREIAQSLKTHPSIATLNLGNNKIRNLGAEHLYELATKNWQLIRIAIDNNPADLKYTELINNTCKTHMKSHLKKDLPNIKENIDKLKDNPKVYQRVKTQIDLQRKRKRHQTVKLHRQVSKLKELERQESLKVKTLLTERSELKQESYELSQTLIELQKNNKTQQIHVNKEINELKEQIGVLTHDCKLIEKNKIKLKQEAALKRLNSELMISKLEQDLKSEGNSLGVANIKLEFAKEKLLKLKESLQTTRFQKIGSVPKCAGK